MDCICKEEVVNMGTSVLNTAGAEPATGVTNNKTLKSQDLDSSHVSGVHLHQSCSANDSFILLNPQHQLWKHSSPEAAAQGWNTGCLELAAMLTSRTTPRLPGGGCCGAHRGRPGTVSGTWTVSCGNKPGALYFPTKVSRSPSPTDRNIRGARRTLTTGSGFFGSLCESYTALRHSLCSFFFLCYPLPTVVTSCYRWHPFLWLFPGW